MIALVLLPVVTAVLNRFRGGGFEASALPGHPRFWVAPIMAVIAGLLLGWLPGVLFGACWLAWCWLPWGYLMCLGHWSPAGRPVSWLEDRLLRLSGERWTLALGLRHLVGVLPMAGVMLSPWPLLIAPAAALSYRVGWAVRPAWAITIGELGTGLAWGVVLLGLAS